MIEEKLASWISGKIGIISKEENEWLDEVRGYMAVNNTYELSKNIFNKIHGKSKQKMLGITYTPNEIRKELTSTVVDELEKKGSLVDVKICDPCCGSGVFSISLIEDLVKRGLDVVEVIENNVYFYDLDKMSVGVSLVTLYVYLAKKGVDATLIDPNCGVMDYFELDKKFDGFITNPPYVKLQNIEQGTRSYLRLRYPDMSSGALGLSSFFLKKMLDDLTEKGVIGIITQNNFFTSNSGVKLRKEIQNNVFKIDNFGSEPIFRDVTAYACLFYLAKEESRYIRFRKIESGRDFKAKVSLIENKSLDSGKWRLGSESELKDLRSLESDGTPLGIACRIWVGIATQLDKAFTVFRIGSSWIGTLPDGEECEVETGLIQPLIRVADLSTLDSLFENNRGVIYPYRINAGKVSPLTEDEITSSYPRTYKYLSAWKEELLARDKGAIPAENWYRWGRSQSMIPVKRKLLTKTFNQGPCFYIDETDSLFSNGYALTVTQDTYSLEFVQSVLNSQVFYYYAKLTSFEIEGGYQCYQKNFIERFCLPFVSMEDQKKILKDGSINDYLVKYFKLNLRLY